MNPVFAWVFPSKSEKTTSWYLIAGILVLSITLWSFFVHQYLLGILLILLVGVFLLYEINTNDEVEIQISEQGVMIDNTLYEMSKVVSFGVVYSRNEAFLIRFTLNQKVVRMIDVFPHPDLDIAVFREYMGQYVVEDENASLTFMEQMLYMLRIY